ncbi:MAG TPA: DMT family transporter [Draconibacterium sp.]|nr:DMT family transporter [Draconibacterium sp.]
MDKITKAHIAVLGANIIYGMSFGAVKMLTSQYMPAFSLNLVRIGVSAPLFWLLFIMKPGKAGIDRVDIGRFVLCALTGVAINQLMFIKGLSLTSSIHASILSLVSPIFITSAAGWLLKEKFTWQKGLGLTLGIGGAATIITARTTSAIPGENMLLGDILIIINAISYSLYFVFVKPLMIKYHPIHVVRWVFTIGAFMILPFGWSDFLQTDFSVFPPSAWMALALVVLGTTFLAYILNIFGIKYLGAGITGTYIYTQPVFASIIGILVLGENFSLRVACAALLIACGVLLATRK